MPVPDQSEPSDCPFAESTDFKWTKDAFRMLDSGDLLGEVISSDGVVRSRVWGPCPGCKHPLDDRQTHTAVTNVFGGEWRSPADGPADPDATASGVEYYQVDVSCGCMKTHDGAPADRTGCGISFRVELGVQMGKGSNRP
jgi:hypothetical protein